MYFNNNIEDKSYVDGAVCDAPCYLSLQLFWGSMFRKRNSLWLRHFLFKVSDPNVLRGVEVPSEVLISFPIEIPTPVFFRGGSVTLGLQHRGDASTLLFNLCLNAATSL